MERGNLIVTRRLNETIVVGEGDSAVIVTLYLTMRGRAKIGVSAPKDTPIRRGEAKPQKEKGAA